MASKMRIRNYRPLSFGQAREGQSDVKAEKRTPVRTIRCLALAKGIYRPSARRYWALRIRIASRQGPLRRSYLAVTALHGSPDDKHQPLRNPRKSAPLRGYPNTTSTVETQYAHISLQERIC